MLYEAGLESPSSNLVTSTWGERRWQGLWSVLLTELMCLKSALTTVDSFTFRR